MQEKIIKEQTYLSQFLGLDTSYFLKGGFWLFSGMIVSTIAGIYLSSLFARLWPRDVYGQFSFIVSTIGFLSIATLPSFGQVIIQSIAEGKEGTYRAAMITQLKWSAIGTTLLILGSIYFLLRGNTLLSIAVFISALAFPINSATNLFSSYLVGKQDFKSSSLYSTFYQVATMILTAIALRRAGYLILVVAITFWVPAIIKTFITLKYLSAIKKPQIDKTFRKLGLALSLTSSMTLGVDYFDRFLIPLFLGFSQNASWAIALIIPTQIHNVLKIFLDLAQPKIAKIEKGDFRKILLSKSLLLEIVVGLTVGFYVLFAPLMFKILYPSYQDVVKISQIYAVSLLYFPNNLFGYFLIKRRAMDKALLSTVIYVFASVLSLLIFVWWWGLIGAAISKIFVRIIQIASTQFIFNLEIKKVTRPQRQ